MGTRVVCAMGYRIFLSVSDVERWFRPFSEMQATDTGVHDVRQCMSQTSGVNPSLYTNYTKKTKGGKKSGGKKGC